MQCELLPTESVYIPISSCSESPAYLPPYDDYIALENDIEDEAPVRRPRPRREPLLAFDSEPPLSDSNAIAIRTGGSVTLRSLLVLASPHFAESAVGRRRYRPEVEVDPSY